MVAMANSSLATLAVMVLWFDPRSIILLAVPTAVVFVAYRAYIREREKHERLELLYESSRLLHYAPELDSAIGALLEHARRMFRAERAELMLFPEPSLDAALCGVPRAVPTAPRRWFPSPSPLGRPAARQDDERGTGVQRPARRSLDDRSRDQVEEAMIGPLVGEHGVFGALTIINRLGEGTSFEPDDLRLLETVANQAAVALENGQLEQSLHELSRLKEELRHQAFHDSLTGPPQPARVRRRGRAADVAWRTADEPPVVASSTSTTSRSSTTRSVTPPATSCSSRSPSGSPNSSGRATWSPASAATSSPCSRSAARRSRRRWPCRHRIITVARAAVPDPRHRRHRRLQRRDQPRPGRAPRSTRSCATPTSRCTAPRPTASAARRSSIRRCTARSSNATR